MVKSVSERLDKVEEMVGKMVSDRLDKVERLMGNMALEPLADSPAETLAGLGNTIGGKVASPSELYASVLDR